MGSNKSNDEIIATKKGPKLGKSYESLSPEKTTGMKPTDSDFYTLQWLHYNTTRREEKLSHVIESSSRSIETFSICCIDSIRLIIDNESCHEIERLIIIIIKHMFITSLRVFTSIYAV